MIQCLLGCLRPASTCLPRTLLRCSTCRCHLALFRRITKMRTSFLALRSRRFLVEILLVIDRYLICRFFPSYLSVQFTEYLSSAELLPVHQSAYRKFHSTETALLKVVTDLIQAIDAGDHALLGLLDLSAAFDTVDHDVLVEHLARTYGLRSTALDWLRS